MTPTEQDKELREKVAAIIEYWDFSPLQDEDSRIERLKNEIMQLITADRECVALEARIEAAEHIQNTMVHEAGGYCDEILPDAIPDYIAELKAQQEEV